MNIKKMLKKIADGKMPSSFDKKDCEDFGFSFLPLIDNYRMGMIIKEAIDKLKVKTSSLSMLYSLTA